MKLPRFTLRELFLLVVIAAMGCGPSAKPVRQIANTAIPAHALRELFIGTWQAADTSTITISQNADGSATINYPPGPEIETVVNNVRWQDDQLQFDAYQYLPNNHPYSGVRSTVTLQTTEDSDRLLKFVESESLPRREDGELKRLPDR